MIVRLVTRLFCVCFGHAYVLDGLSIRCQYCKDKR